MTTELYYLTLTTVLTAPLWVHRPADPVGMNEFPA